MTDPPIPIGVLVAALGGLAIGVERQWSGHASGPRARFAGVRTFALLGGLAGLAGWLLSQGAWAPATVLLAAGGAIVVAAYVVAGRVEIDATTEVSALVVLGAGTVAGLGHLTLASAVVATTSFFLVEKSRLHALVTRIDDESLRAAARFAVMAAVVLPLLPAGPYGPWGTIRPREIWLLVLFVSGLSFVGFVVRRATGAAHGYAIAGLIGGLVSSTNVTLAFARHSRDALRLRQPLAAGVIAASTVLFLRVAVVTAALNPPVAAALAIYMAPPFLIGVLALVWGLRTGLEGTHRVEPVRNPLQVGAALQMAALFQLVLLAVEAIRRTWGDVGILASGAVLGITDVDALTVAMARGAAAGIPIDVAARAIAVGILANTALKAGIAVVFGAPTFRRFAATPLAAMGMALGAAVVWWR